MGREVSLPRPILFLDVDGPLNPYAAHSALRPDGYVLHKIEPFEGTGEFDVWLNPAHGPMLLDLAEKARAELVWATTWGHQANEHIGHRIGLPELPVVEFGRISAKTWKWRAVAKYAEDRPLAWLDDDFDTFSVPGRDDFNDERRGYPTLLEPISPRLGITVLDLADVADWMARHAR